MDDLFLETYNLLSNFEWIHNFQVTNVFKDDICSKIPASWCSCLSKLSTEELNEIPFLGGNCKSKYPDWPPSLHDFVTKSSHLSTFRDTGTHGSKLNHIEISHDMARGMNNKKLHEVTRMASLINDTVTQASCNLVVDVGSGLGYLDHVLHQKYGIGVIGMETVQSHASAAEKRAVKQGITCGGIQSIQCHIADNADSFETFVSTVESVHATMQCKCCSDLRVANDVQDANVRICLIGLHCCGDLSPTMMSYFSSCDKIKAICCVCCCYHKMSYLDEKFKNFPLSDAGKEIYKQCVDKHGKHFLSPYTLRLGAQETRHRWRRQTEKDHESHIQHVAFRALLSLTEEDEGYIRQKVRHCCFDSFHSFTKSFYSLSSDDSSSVDEKRNHLYSLYDAHKKEFESIEILTLLQVILQPVIEMLLYQDRVQWFKEKGHGDARIVPIFDELISPRNLAIVAIKS